MTSLRSRCITALATLATSLVCAVAHAGFSVPVVVPIEVNVLTNPIPVTAPTVTGSFTYGVACTNSQGAASSFTFLSPALTLTVTALATPFSPKPSGNALAQQASSSFEIIDPKDCVVTQLSRPTPPIGYVWASAPVAPITVTNFSNNETQIAPDTTASFTNTLVPVSFTVTAVANPALGGNTVACLPTAVGLNGTSSCTATAGAAYNFTGFTSTCGAGASTNNPYDTGPVTANCTVTGNFALKSYTVTTSVSPTGSGTLSCLPNPVTHGATATCTAQPNAGYALTGLSGCSGVPSTTSPYTTGAVTAACIVTATFQQLTVPITTAAIVANGGSVTCLPNPATYGTASNCTATANAGYVLIGISGCGGVATTTSPFVTGPITTACTVTARFSAPFAAPAAVPTLSVWSMMLLALLVALMGRVVYARRQSV
jgi:uncharacterized protein YceK